MLNNFKLVAIAMVAILGAGSAPGARADTYVREVLVVNHSHTTIREFHASNVSRSGYEEDILGRRVLPPGGVARINLDDGSGYCRFDFLTIFEDGTRVERRNVDVCTVTQYTLTD
jgi:hypothetical protein